MRGKITLSDDGSTLPGVNVVIKGTSTGTTSGADGTYRIDAASDATLVFSFVGYATAEVPVGQRTTIDVVLQTDVTGLDEVVVIGYGSVKKTDLTGAVNLVDPKELTKVNTNNVTQLLQGRVAGVAMNSDGQPGASPKVTIRGVSTFGTGGTDSEPLCVVDGLPLGSTTASTGARAQPSGTFNPIRDINPNDIESIQVLKDASVSAAINNGELIIAVVNRHRDKAISTDVLLQEGSSDGNFMVYEVNGPDVKAENDFTSEKVATKEKASINAKGQKITYSFPAHSFTLLKGKIK